MKFVLMYLKKKFQDNNITHIKCKVSTLAEIFEQKNIVKQNIYRKLSKKLKSFLIMDEIKLFNETNQLLGDEIEQPF